MTQPSEPQQPNQPPAHINPYNPNPPMPPQQSEPLPPPPMQPTAPPTASAPLAQQPGEPLPAIHRDRRRPRFTTPPPPETHQADANTVLDRMSLLGELHADNPQPAFGRNRHIAGSLPSWSPQPPGEIFINRSRTQP